MLSLGHASIYIIFIMFPLQKYQIINAFYNFLSGYMLCALLTKLIEIEDNTSLEAVTLTEKNENEVFKLLNLL